jgi:hypothetical protein
MSKGQSRTASIDAVPVPPPDPRPYVTPITLPGNRETAFMALHASVMGFRMHWVDNQHLPHIRDKQWCAGCRLGTSFRWEGFLGVVSCNTRNRFILRIPAAAFRNSGLFREKSDSRCLAGAIFTSYRFGKGTGKNRPAIIELLDNELPFPRAHAFPLEPALARLWNMERIDVVEQLPRPEDTEPEESQTFARAWQNLKNEDKYRKGAKP